MAARRLGKLRPVLHSGAQSCDLPISFPVEKKLAEINPLERKLAKRTPVGCAAAAAAKGQLSSK